MNIYNMTDGFYNFTVWGSRICDILVMVLARQDHMFEKLIPEITKVYLFTCHLHYKKE